MYPAGNVYGCYLTVKTCLIAVLSDSFQRRKQSLDVHFNSIESLPLARCSLGRDQRQMSGFHIFTQHPLWVVTHTAWQEPKKKARKNLTLEIPKKEDRPWSMTCFKEMSPVVDTKGEFTEVQVLEEGEIFDPEQFLDQLEKNTSTPTCPRHLTPMKFNSIKRPYGSTGEYYRCPSSKFSTRSYVTCGAHKVHKYLRRAYEQTHPSYEKMDPTHFWRQCNKSLVPQEHLQVLSMDRRITQGFGQSHSDRWREPVKERRKLLFHAMKKTHKQSSPFQKSLLNTFL